MGFLTENEGASRAEEQWQFSTLAAQAGFCQGGNAHSLTGKGKAIWTASVFEFDSLDEYAASPYQYRRFKSPNSDDLAHAIASLESAEAGLVTSSGMGAVVASVFGLLNSGDLVVVHSDTYGGTFDFFNIDVQRFGINVKFVDVLQVHNVESSLSVARNNIGPDKKVMVFLETITNPVIRVADVAAIGAVVKKYEALLVVDNTFSTPLREKPLLQGADLVVHSMTKYLGGHSDLIAGAVVGPYKYVEKAAKVAARWGLMAAPFDSWLGLRSIRSLQVRMERAWATTNQLVELLSESDFVLHINSAPKCAVFSFEVYGGLEGVSRALATFHLIKLAPSLGGVTTTVSHSASSSHKMIPPVERQKLGIPDGLLRISVGLEHVNDIWRDLQRGLAAAKFQTLDVIDDKVASLSI